MPAAIELKNINKRFGPVQANRDVSLKVESGTIHGIIGEIHPDEHPLWFLSGRFRKHPGSGQ